MKQLIIANDLKNLWREKLVTFVIAISLIFAVLAFYNGYQFSQSQLSVIDTAKQQQQTAIDLAKQGLAARLNNNDAVNWWDDVYDLRGQAFYLMVNYATKQPLATAPIATGQADVFPYYFRMLITEKQNIVQQYDYVNPLQLLLGQFDLAFVIIYLLPLLIIGLSYNALSQEQQSGQLRLQLLQGANPWVFLYSQLILRALLVLLPFLIAANSLLFFYSEGYSITNAAAFSTIVVVYCLFWSCLCGFIISRGKSAANNATILMTSWLCLVIIIPTTFNTINLMAHPTPSRVHYIDSLRSNADAANKASEKTLAKFFSDHPELTANNNGSSDYATKKIATIIAIEKAMQPYDEQFAQAIATQQQYAQNYKFLSPATLVYSALVEFAGNGLTRQNAYMSAVEKHHQKLQQFFKIEIVKASQAADFSPCNGCNAEPTVTDLSTIPQFSMPTSTSPFAIWSLALLFLISLGLFVITKRRVTQIGLAHAQQVVV